MRPDEMTDGVVLTCAIPEWKAQVLSARWGCALRSVAPAKLLAVARRARPAAVLIGADAWGPALAAAAADLARGALAPAILLLGASWRRPPDHGADVGPVIRGVLPETAERSQWESTLRAAAEAFAGAGARHPEGACRPAPVLPSVGASQPTGVGLTGLG